MDRGPTPPARQEAPAAHPLDGGAAVHGPLAAGQVVVYLLDASGSMGEAGKFDAARRALVATLRQQPPGVRFQVIVYSSAAVPPLPAPLTGCVPATADNVGRMADAVAGLGRPGGRSDHAAGLRAAVDLRPTAVVFFTDADEPPAAAFRATLRGRTPPPAVYVARVRAGEVRPPVEWR